MTGPIVNADAYLTSLQIEVTEAAKPAIGRLALGGEFRVGAALGVLLRPKRGEVSDRYLELLASEGYEFVIVDSGDYPAFYAREGATFAPLRALPIRTPEHFPSEEVLHAWARLVRAAAGRGEPAHTGVAQLVARLDGDNFGPDLVRADGGVPIARLGGDKSVAAEPLRTAAALLAGYRLHPSSPTELALLLTALSSLASDKAQFSGLAEILAPFVQTRQLGARRLVVSGGAGAELSALLGADGTFVLPSELRFVEPLLERLLPGVERRFSNFLQSKFAVPYDGVVVVPPLGHHLSGADLSKFELAKRDGKVRVRVAVEMLFVEQALAATANGGLLVTVLPEGLLSSAGHSDFRAWLLERARLVAVVGMPVGTCFRGINVKCSVVLLQKPASADDYPILMIDVEADDLRSDIAVAKAKLEEFLAREVAACA